MRITAYSDASIRPDGSAGAGYVILASSGNPIDSQGQWLGSGYTNSTKAELEALLLLLHRLETVAFQECEIFLDSVPALRILERPPAPAYGDLIRQIRAALARIPGKVDFSLVPRVKNLEANRLALRAADKPQEKGISKAFALTVGDWLSEFEPIPSFGEKFRYRHKTLPYVFIKSSLDLRKALGDKVFCIVAARLEKDPRVTTRRFQRGWNLQIKPLAERTAPETTWEKIRELVSPNIQHRGRDR